MTEFFSLYHQLPNTSTLSELVNTFGGGPVVLPVGGLQEEILNVVQWRDTVGQQTKHDEATGSNSHLPIRQFHTHIHVALH